MELGIDLDTAAYEANYDSSAKTSTEEEKTDSETSIFSANTTIKAGVVLGGTAADVVEKLKENPVIKTVGSVLEKLTEVIENVDIQLPDTDGPCY